MKKFSLCLSCFLRALCAPDISERKGREEPQRTQRVAVSNVRLRVFLATLFGFAFSVTACAQTADTGFRLVRTYNGNIAGAALDNLDNLYIISTTGQVKKLGPRGDSIGVFNGVRAYGKLSAIDVSNPLKPLLFYKDFSNVVVLDRFLATRTSLNLRQFNIVQPSAIGLSYDNNIWVYDAFDNKLKKIDEAGTVLQQTDDFRQLFGQSFAPQKIINDGGFVYLADSAAGIFVFDNYGTFKRKIPLMKWNAVDVWGGSVVRLSGDAVLVYNPVNFAERRMAFPSSFKPYLHSFTHHNRLVTFEADSLKIYRIEN